LLTFNTPLIQQKFKIQREANQFLSEILCIKCKAITSLVSQFVKNLSKTKQFAPVLVFTQEKVDFQVCKGLSLPLNEVS